MFILSIDRAQYVSLWPSVVRARERSCRFSTPHSSPHSSPQSPTQLPDAPPEPYKTLVLYHTSFIQQTNKLSAITMIVGKIIFFILGTVLSNPTSMKRMVIKVPIKVPPRCPYNYNWPRGRRMRYALFSVKSRFQLRRCK